MGTALFVAVFVLVPIAVLATAVWVVERRLRPDAIAPSRRLLVYMVACVLAAVGPAWVLGEVYGVVMRPSGAEVPGPGETWVMLTVGLSSFGTVGMGLFDRARSIWLHRQWARKRDPYATRAGTGTEDQWWRAGDR